jgi:hypothetical protein
MFSLIGEGIKLLRDLVKPTPGKMKKVRNAAGGIATGSAAVLTATATDGAGIISPEVIALLPEPWTAIISGACTLIAGIVALLAQSKTRPLSEAEGASTALSDQQPITNNQQPTTNNQ